jgi:hypothetical protein
MLNRKLRMKMRLLTVLVVSGMAAGLLGTGAATAATTEGVIPSGFVTVSVVKNVDTNLCLDDSSFGLRGITCNGLAFQGWSIYYNSAVLVMLNVDTGLCLDDSSFGLRAISCNGLDFQEWYYYLGQNGWILENVNTGLCLDDSSYGLRAISYNGLDFQEWYIPGFLP